jgi:N-acetylneuraminic acid mutarotase
MSLRRVTGSATVLAAAIVLAPAASARELSFAERVQAQEAILRVAHAHQIGATEAFENAMPRSRIEQQVRTYLEESAALERFWSTPITAAMLEAEVRRMAARTRMPDRLREMFAALGNDPVLIQECVARSLLADRLARDFFAYDRTIHSDARWRADALLAGLEEGRIDPQAVRPDRSVLEVVRRTAAGHGDRSDADPGRLLLDEALFERYAASLGPAGALAQAGVPPTMTEESDRFEIRVPLAADPDHLQVATYVVPKESWDAWWTRTGARLVRTVVPVVASESFRIPAPVAAPQAACAENSWQNGILDDVPDPRSGHTAVWTGTEMLLWGGEGANSTGYRYDPTTNTWTTMSVVGAPPSRLAHTAVWTGTHMLIWGGRSQSAAFDTGYRYDPAADAWTPISTVGAPAARFEHTAVWTGGAMLVWGGRTLTPLVILGDGGAYDPGTDTWTPISGVGAPSPRLFDTAIWTGERMVIWGGVDGTNTYLADGSRYDPATDTWATTSVTGAPSGRDGHSAVWGGGRMLLWGGGNGSTSFKDGARYDPVADRWFSMATINAPTGVSGHSAVWTGTKMIIWGGRDSFSNVVVRADRYDPASDVWTPSLQAGPFNHDGQSAVWTGQLMVVWGGSTNGMNIGGRYDPATDLWTSTASSPPGAPARRIYHTAVWTGASMIVWGGAGFLNSGGRYDPATDTWTPTTTTNAPAGRYLHTAVWTGSRMIVWGGQGQSNCFISGGNYDPLSDAWTATTIGPLTDIGCKDRTAVWTGQRMIVWGGHNSSGTLVNTGTSYDPVANTAQAIATAGAASARYVHSAVWTGSRMIVWGGSGGAGVMNTGAQYDPAHDSWSPTSTAMAPQGRNEHTVVWSGDRMIIWGGFGVSGVLNDGGSYDPALDVWTPLATAGAPQGRVSAHAVWTGDAMVVWGGQNLGDPIGGGIYDPALDRWAPVSVAGEPTERWYNSALWSGSRMIVWGGTHDGNDQLNTGGQFCACSFRPWYPDGDGDGVGDASAQTTACGQPAGYAATGGDCNDQDPADWAVPGETSGLTFTDAVSIAWTPPSQPGAAGVGYDLLRTTVATDFQAAAACVASDTVLNSATDTQTPAPGQAFYYLVRAENGCPGGAGLLGMTSGGAPIVGRNCP